MSTSIPISELNALNQVSSSDLIPIVQESTLTTFNTSLGTVGSWISSSVQSSSSLSARSSSYALSSDSSTYSNTSLNSNNLIYPNTSTASFAITSSNAISASWAPVQTITSVAISASWASRSLWSTTSSFASQSISASWAPVPLSASWASASLTATSSSYSSVSTNATYAASASYVPTSSINAINFVKAFGTFYATGSLNTTNGRCNWLPFSGSYNFISASYQGSTYQYQGFGGMVSSSLGFIYPQNRYGAYHTWIFYMSTPMPTTNYTIMTSVGGEQNNEWLEMGQFPYASRTTTAFSMSRVAGDTDWNDRGTAGETNWMSIMVLHP